MNDDDAPASQQGVPTLTEVVVWPVSAPVPLPMMPIAEAQPLESVMRTPGATPPAMPLPLTTDALPPSPPPAAAPAAINQDQLVQHVLAGLQRQLDLMLDYRLREILAPLLTRAADNLIREARGELASTLRDLVSRAVEHELGRHRTR